MSLSCFKKHHVPVVCPLLLFAVYMSRPRFHAILTSWCACMQATPVPSLKDGNSGHFDLHNDSPNSGDCVNRVHPIAGGYVKARRNTLHDKSSWPESSTWGTMYLEKLWCPKYLFVSIAAPLSADSLETASVRLTCTTLISYISIMHLRSMPFQGSKGVFFVCRGNKCLASASR
jgi:hypothetical protein